MHGVPCRAEEQLMRRATILALALLAVACSGSVEYDETCELLTVRPVQPNGGCCDDVVPCASGRCVDGTCESGVV